MSQRITAIRVSKKARVKKTNNGSSTVSVTEIEVEELSTPRKIVKSKVSKPVKAKKVARKKAPARSSQTVFDLHNIENPLSGTPKEVQTELDGLALQIQPALQRSLKESGEDSLDLNLSPEDEEAFDRILAYIHKYLLGLVFRKFSFVRGYEESDIYQESLIALFKKAIPNFDPTRNMSFLNFAKMCINRHLITILHASKHRRKDMPINNSISLDSSPSGDDEDGSCTLSDIIPDEKQTNAPYNNLSNKEAFSKTLEMLTVTLSPFETLVLEEYLAEKSYKEAAKNISKKLGIKHNAKSIDNSLLRIRSKALKLFLENGQEAIPLFQ